MWWSATYCYRCLYRFHLSLHINPVLSGQVQIWYIEKYLILIQIQRFSNFCYNILIKSLYTQSYNKKLVAFSVQSSPILMVTFSLVLLITVKYFTKSNFIGLRKTAIWSSRNLGCNSSTQKTVNNIVNHGAPTTLSLGDNSYQNTTTCWFNYVKPLDGDANPSNPKRVKITIGNHDDTNS